MSQDEYLSTEKLGETPCCYILRPQRARLDESLGVHGDLSNDIIYGDLGNDIIFDGEGDDIIVYHNCDGHDIIEYAGPEHDTLRCEGVTMQKQYQDGDDLIFEMSVGGQIRSKNRLLCR